MWSKNGNQGNKWLLAQTTIQSTNSNYSINFEGIIGNGYRGDIAIDDVSVTPGTCTLPGNINMRIVWVFINASDQYILYMYMFKKTLLVCREL